MKKKNEINTSYTNTQASNYDEIRFTTKHGLIFHKLEFRQLKKAIKKIKGHSHILEVGCGTARFSGYLAQNSFDVIAIDPSQDMIDISKTKFSNVKNIEFKIAEGAKLPFEKNVFDFTFAIRVMNSTESEDYALKSIKEMIRVTKPNGLILIEFANKSRPFVRKTGSTFLTFEQITKLAKVNSCSIKMKSGVLVFSQTILEKIPSPFLSVWSIIERVSAKFLWRFSSRGYIILKKEI